MTDVALKAGESFFLFFAASVVCYQFDTLLGESEGVALRCRG